MKIGLSLLFLFHFGLVNSQSLGDLSFGEHETLDILTWNIKFFPTDVSYTADSVKLIVESLSADIIAIQEIDDNSAFDTMVETMEGYVGYSQMTDFLDLGYIVNTDSIEVLDVFDIYTEPQFFLPFPRPPMVMEFMFRGDFYVVINNHYKCCGDGIIDLQDTGDEEYRRLQATYFLKQYVESNYPDVPVIILGDLNDELTDSSENNVFQFILDDPENFLFADYGIATGPSSEWSYPSFPSHIDHIVITNEFYEAFNNPDSQIETLHIDEYLAGGYPAYNAIISDHRPVALKLQVVESSLGVADYHSRPELKIYPNPASDHTMLSFPSGSAGNTIDIFDASGRRVGRQLSPSGKPEVRLELSELNQGLYYIRTGSYVSKLLISRD